MEALLEEEFSESQAKTSKDARHLFACKTYFWLKCARVHAACCTGEAGTSSSFLSDSTAKEITSSLERVLALRPGTRIDRLASVLDLSRRDVDALCFLVLHCCGALSVPCWKDEGTIVIMQRACNMSGKDALSLFSPDRALVKEGIVELSEEFSSFWGQAAVRMQRGVMSALWGDDLVSEDFLSLGEGAIQAILRDEDPSRYEGVNYLPGEEENDVTSELLDPDLSPNDIISEMEMMERANEKDEEGDKHTIEMTNVPLEKKIYKSDLEYLTDATKIVNLRFRMFKLKEEADGESDGINLRTKSAKQMIRELKSQESSAFAKWKCRISQTRASGSWLPRMEVLARHLALTDFEKNVLPDACGFSDIAKYKGYNEEPFFQCRLGLHRCWLPNRAALRRGSRRASQCEKILLQVEQPT